MGVWGNNPWENDSAADWFSSAFAGVDLEARISTGLDDESPDRCRAAAYLLSLLGNPYVWPGDPGRLARLVDKALTRMESLASDGEYLSGYADRAGLILSIGYLVGVLQSLRNQLRTLPE